MRASRIKYYTTVTIVIASIITSFAQIGIPPRPPQQPPAGQGGMLGSWGAPWNGPLSQMANGANQDIPSDEGICNVISCGYDAQGIWRVVPLNVSYNYNGAQYDVTVNNAWNPWTDTWEMGINIPAINTYYFLKGNYFNFYVVLTTGTYYFNL
jgi:hypothetical protein